MERRLLEWAQERGYRVAWGPASVVAEARRGVLERRERGEIEAGFFRDAVEALTGDALPGLASVVAVAKPAPAHLVRFRRAGAAVEALLPPTYVRYRATFEEVRQDLARHGLPGARVEQIDGPLKAVAERLGLVRYGRNNVTYAEGLGSYVQLCLFATDAELPTAAAAAAPALLEACAGCAACAAVCPTGAIDGERVLLHGERCLTRFNEVPGDWPEWLPAAAHECLLGCVACQQVCPANGEMEVVDTGVEFSETETRTLLEGGGDDGGRAGFGVRCKLAWLGQPYAEPVLGRNLRALLAARG